MFEDRKSQQSSVSLYGLVCQFTKEIKKREQSTTNFVSVFQLESLSFNFQEHFPR